MLNDALNRNIFKESIHGLLSKDESIKESEVDSPTSPLQSVFSYARNESSLVEKDESNIMYRLDTSKEKALPVISKRAHRLSNELSLRRDTVNPLVSRLTSMGMAPSVDINRPFNINDLNFVLSVDNKTLEYSLENSKCRQLLVTLLFTAQSTCFHSLLPDDKTKVAKLLKESFSFRPVFLAVGDSGSDVGMIQEAHIGVGLMGNEGAQAANASEIVITKFSDLTELILCEGH